MTFHLTVPVLYDLTVSPLQPVWYIYRTKQKDTGIDWTCDENFGSITQLTTDAATTVITLSDTNGDGKNDKAEVTVNNAFPGYYNSLVFDVKNTGTLPISMSQVRITNGDPDSLQVRLLESSTSTIDPGYRKAVGIDFRVQEGAAPGVYTFTVAL